MHRDLNAFLLLSLICALSLLVTISSNKTEAASTVKFGVRVWNYNTTHVVPNADVSLLNKTLVEALGSTNQTGWVNLTAPNTGTFTLQVKVQAIMVYNASFIVSSTTTFQNLTNGSVKVADYSFIAIDTLSHPVQNVEVDVKVNTTLLTSPITQANGTAVARNLPFATYNVTALREQVTIVSNSTVVVNATTYTRNTALPVKNYNYTLTVKDYTGANLVHGGTVNIYDWGVPSVNSTKPLDTLEVFRNLWPGKYWLIVVTRANVTIWRSLETISTNTTRSINANIGYTLTLHIFDALYHPIPSIQVNLILNGSIIATKSTDPTGTVLFSGLPESTFSLNFNLLGRAYFEYANINGASADIPFKVDDVIILAGTPFNTAPLAASSTVILSIVAGLGTFLLYRKRKGMSASSKSERTEVS